MTDTKISTKHIAVVDAYIANGFKREAAVIASGYKPSRARQTAVDIFKRPEVKAYLAERMKDNHMAAEEALLRLGGHAAGNVTDFIGLTIDELKAHPLAALIKRVKFVTYFPEVDPSVLEANDKKADSAAAPAEAPKAVQYVESIELYDAQAAMREIIRQSQLANGLPTESINVPQLVEFMELLSAAGKDFNSIISRMTDKLKAETQP